MRTPVRCRGFLFSLFLAGLGGRAQSAPATEPHWLDEAPIVVAGSWDHSLIFETRFGLATRASRDESRRERSEETIRQMHELGVTLVIVPFFKGFGLEAEKDGIEETRQMVPLCHKYGIRVGVYVGSTIAYETFLAELPEAKDWFVPDYLGNPVRYPHQYFRKRVYFMHPGYRAYIKRVVRLAIQDLKVDLIHFDNTSLQSAAAIFHHPVAAADFRAYLQGKYTAEERKERLGFSNVSFVEPPTMPEYPGGISDPLAQEWTDFRCHQLQAYYSEMTAYIRSLNPEVADDCNPSAGLSGPAVIWLQGVDYPGLVPQVDVVWTEEGSKVGLDEQGILWSKIRSYKMATFLGRRVFTYTGSSGSRPKLANAEAVDHPKLAMAEAMAFNRGCLGMVCQPLAAAQMPRDQAEYIRFTAAHYGLLNRSRNLAEVAVLHSYPSMAYNTGEPWQSTMLVEQVLLRNHIPFDIIFDRQLADLGKYRVVILADQESLSDGQISAISHFIEKGGGVVATENSALYDERRLGRPETGLMARFGASPSSGSTPESGGAARGMLGQGRLSCLRAILPGKTKPESAPMSEAYCALPLNDLAITNEVLWSAGGELSFATDAPSSVVASVAEGAGGERLVHLLNYDPDHTPLRRNITLTVGNLGSGKVKAVRLLSPDGISDQMHFEQTGNSVRILVPRLETYDLIAISF